MDMDPFDLNTAPLKGVTLIEAGAGTGKTFTLSGIFLKLIVDKGLAVDQILVVTYTKAATEELKTRIRQRLSEAKHAFSGAKAKDDVLALWVQQAINPKEAIQRVEDALTNFDRAAIFTIHGFCQRLLQHYAFETGHLFQSELVQDNQPLVQEMVQDFWRRHISNAPYELAHFCLHQLKGPDQLTKVLDHCAYPHVRVLPAADKPDLSAIDSWRRESETLLQLWALHKEQILNILLDPGLNARYYGKCETAPGQSSLTHRQIRLAEFAAALDQWNGKYPLEDNVIKYLKRSSVEKYTKKGHTVIEHPFFELCERSLNVQNQMVRQMEDYLRYLKLRLHRQAPSRMGQKKRCKNVMFFDDLLLGVHSALVGQQGHALSRAVRAQYKAALVDEFQDTDLLQYEIFQNLFVHSDQILFMIGDPKQAIYSFRGADLFSYFAAANGAQHQWTLTRNWRSTPTLIKAFNALFSNHPRPFGFKEIAFNPAVTAQRDAAEPTYPLMLWYLARTEEEAPSKPIAQGDAHDAICDGVAAEIVRLLSDGHEKVEPWQIAVLTRTHAQSQLIKNALVRKKVPAVLHSAGSVFNSPEAETMVRVLAAVSEPNDPRKVRAALVDDMFGLGAHYFHGGMDNPDDHWQVKWHTFHQDHQNWLRRGFYPMFCSLMAREKVKSRLLSLPNGERRITNVLHLAELLHQAESEHRLGPDGLIKWLNDQRQSGKESDERQLRLESDAHAVRIITMHKSKGLQFDIVFCPFTWGGVRMDRNAAVFHDTRQQNQITLSIGPDIPFEHLVQARKELLAENLRMLYVALTRAKQRCYMVWGRINGTELSAPAYLLHGGKCTLEGTDWLSSLMQKMKTLSDKKMIQELHQLAGGSQGSIQIEPLPDATPMIYQPGADGMESGSHRTLQREIESNWRMASFSSLTAGLAYGQNAYTDRDFYAGSGIGGGQSTEEFKTLFDFPKGAHAGLFFHDLLEHWDHTCEDPSSDEELVHSKLITHGFDPRWQATIQKLLGHLSDQFLKAAGSGFLLSDVEMRDRTNEMEFYFPIKRFTSQQLTQCFKTHSQYYIFDGQLQAQMDRLTFAPLRGFMKGYIDTVFQYQQQYFLVDWKSNHLGDHVDHYKPKHLSHIMVDDFYFLQYHLYTIALNRHLQQTVQNYDYDRHFGGVFYLFLRGIGGPPSDTNGVFFDKPHGRLISDLDALLIGMEC